MALLTRSIVRHPHWPAARSMCSKAYTGTVASLLFQFETEFAKHVKIVGKRHRLLAQPPAPSLV